MRHSIRNATLTAAAAAVAATFMGGVAQAAVDPTVTSLGFAAPTALTAGASATEFTAHVEGGTAGLSNAWIKTDFTGVDQNKFTLEYKDATGTWQPLTGTVNGDANRMDPTRS